MRCIKIKDGEDAFYLPKEQIEMIEMNPCIQEVPGSPAGVGGISWHNGNLIIYYGTVKEGQERQCGILWKPPEKKPAGLLADEILEESELENWEEEQQKVSVHYGFRTGENLSDTTK